MENNRKNIEQNIGLYIFECIMAVLYLAISYVFLFTDIFSDAVADKSIRLGLGALLGAYGIFRVYRAFLKYRQNKKSEE